MRSFLMVWNPARWSWEERENDLVRSEKEGSWSCGNRKDLPVGSRIFLIRLGREPKGLVGAGISLSKPKKGPHFDPVNAAEGKSALYVKIRWHSLCRTPKIPMARLERPPFAEFRWTAQGSGIEIPGHLAEALASEWAVADQDDAFRIPEEVALDSGYLEGAVRTALINVYERDPRARDECIRHHGTTCSVCGLDFGAVYGDIAKDFIHVHHVVPLCTVGRGYKVNPVKDLRPVCPNCHAVLHMQDPPMETGELRRRLRGANGVGVRADGADSTTFDRGMGRHG